MARSDDHAKIFRLATPSASLEKVVTLRGSQVSLNLVGHDDLRQVVVTEEDTLLVVYESYEDECE